MHIIDKWRWWTTFSSVSQSVKSAQLNKEIQFGILLSRINVSSYHKYSNKLFLLIPFPFTFAHSILYVREHFESLVCIYVVSWVCSRSVCGMPIGKLLRMCHSTPWQNIDELCIHKACVCEEERKRDAIYEVLVGATMSMERKNRRRLAKAERKFEKNMEEKGAELVEELLSVQNMREFIKILMKKSDYMEIWMRSYQKWHMKGFSQMERVMSWHASRLTWSSSMKREAPGIGEFVRYLLCCSKIGEKSKSHSSSIERDFKLIMNY